MEDKEPRSALFTVRDAEEALVCFTLFLLAILVGIFLHEILLEAQKWSDALYTVLKSKPHALAWTTGLTISMEGGIIMFTRLKDYQDRRKKRFDEAKAEGKAEGKVEGKAEGKTEVYEEIAAWNARRLAAEERNEPFTEPFPSAPEPPAK